MSHATQAAQERVNALRRPHSLVVYCTHGLADPLVAPLMLDYLVHLQRENGFAQVLLFTEEPPGAAVPAWAEQLLKDARTRWVPLRYDVRGRQWLQRIMNLSRMIWCALKFRLAHGRCWQVGYLSFGGAYAAMASALGLGRFIVVCFEPHSHYMIELGIWPQGSLKAKVVAWTERLQMRKAAALIVPTSAVREHARAQRPQGKLVLQAITIDTRAAAFDAQARMALRRELGIPADAWVVAYVGKFGGIYHSVDQYLDFLVALGAADAGIHFLIITQQEEIERLRASGRHAFLADRLHVIPPVAPEALSRHLSVADAGVVAIPPTPAQAFRTPVKTAHYWSAGLPIIIPKGVSDDHRIAMEEDTGIAVADIAPKAAVEVAAAMQRWRQQDSAALKARCMACALAYRDTAAMVRTLREVLHADS
jgi:hypothetical protein